VKGHILNITSMGAQITLPGISCYCGSKFALEGISETVGKEVKPFGIAVKAVAPVRSARTGQDVRWSERPAPLLITAKAHAAEIGGLTTVPEAATC
jgi:short-subunit dehydrogenase